MKTQQYRKFLTLVSFFTVSIFFTYANTFVVTSSADSGPGTLRDAITLANANGTSVTDYIHFNLAGITITLQSDLPYLTSNLIIDGSTQPGAFLGVSTAKVIIQPAQPNNTNTYCFYLLNCSNVEIYGLVIKNFTKYEVNYPGGFTVVGPNLLPMSGVSNIKIGGPGRGNVFCGSYSCISKNYTSGTGINITIQSNFFGVDTDGHTVLFQGSPNGSLNYDCNVVGIQLTQVGKVLIGGDNDNERNIISGTYASSVSLIETFDTVVIKNNFIGTDVSGDSAVSVQWGAPTAPIGARDCTGITIIDNNVIIKGIVFFSMKNIFYIKRNIIGLNKTKTSYIGTSGLININQNYQLGIIGGADTTEGNTIANSLYGVANGYNSYPLMISHNSIYCTQYEGIAINIFGGNDPSLFPYVNINTISAGGAGGTATPNSKIELFYDDDCPSCNGKTFITQVLSDASGNWAYNGPLSGAVTATATNKDSATSEFAKPKLYVDSVKIVDATCGKNNGSIRGIKIVSGTYYTWINENDSIVGTDTILTNVGFGSYRLRVSIGPYGCQTTSQLFFIMNVDPPPTIAASIIHATCGSDDGGIACYYNGVAFTGKWLNATGDSLGVGLGLTHIFAGTYYFKLWAIYDTSCNKIYGPFQVNNLFGPSLNTNNLQITPATCGDNNGAINGITGVNVTGSSFISWEDSLGNIVGNTLNVGNLPPGKYRLKFKDESICDAITTSWYTIANAGGIVIDTTQILVTGSECGASNGSIQNISVTGATTYKWINSSGQVVSTSLSLGGVLTGSYVLIASNAFGCQQQTDSILVPIKPFTPVTTILQTEGRSGTCDQLNGYMNILNFPDPQLYTFRWVDSLHPTVTFSTSLNLSGFNSGNFTLYAKNATGCEQIITTAQFAYIKPTAVNESGVKITNEVCSDQAGSIEGITAMGGTGIPPFSYKWIDANNTIVSTQQQLTNVGGGTYRLIINDITNCADTSSYLAIENMPVSLAKPVYTEQSISTGSHATLTVQNHQQGIYYIFNDAFSTTSLDQNTSGIFITPTLTQNRSFYIELINGICKSGRIEVKILVNDKTNIYVPIAFTPNSDSRNDVLKPIAYGPVKLEYFRIYNRYGKPVFYSSDLNKGWDGNVKGIAQPASGFTWILKAKDESTGKNIFKRGSFLLLR